ncbi:MAG: M20/M25/M40 family metallo-hydrolase [Syntrophomonadaceae bacterium]
MNCSENYPIRRERLIDSFLEMVAIDSVSGHEASFRDYLSARFAELGFMAMEDNAGRILNGDSGNLLVKLPGTMDRSPLLLAAHMDTVVPGHNISGVLAQLDGHQVIRSATATILGGDDKAGAAAILEAVRVILENGFDYPPLEILFTVSEEQGLLGIKNFDFSQVRSPMGFVLDSGGDPGSIVGKSPCQNEIEYRVRGIAAHAGMNPEAGRNAIQIMARALAQMPCGRIDSETTCNFGIIEGGLARNIVAPFCRVRGEARSLDRAKLDKLTMELGRLFKQEVAANGGQPEVEVVLLYPEAALQADEEVVKLAVRAAEKIGVAARLESTGGGSDASIINGAGIRCANLGIGMKKVHTVEEYIRVEDLITDAAWIISIVREAVSQ